MFKKIRRLFITIILSSVFLAISPAWAGLNDFDVSNNIVDLDSVLSGGPQKDGIPALTNPEFIKAEEAQYLNGTDLVVGLSINGKHRAYPFNILNWHEIVNDEVSGEPVAVTFCPLTKSAVVFDRRVGDQILEFGVSGLLYNSNVLMYDRNHDGLWSQLYNGSVTGKHSSQRLALVPSVVVTWDEWVSQHPETLVLSKNTGHWRNYKKDPYHFYHMSGEVMFDVGSRDARLPAKDLVIGITIGDASKAFPLEEVNSRKTPLKDKVAGVAINVHPAKNKKSAYMTDQSGKILPATVAYWFAWSTFNKNTEVYKK